MVLMEPHLGQVLELCSWPVNSISKGSLAAVSCAQRLCPLSASLRLASSASLAFFSASSPFFVSSFFLAACEETHLQGSASSGALPLCQGRAVQTPPWHPCHVHVLILLTIRSFPQA